MVGCTEESSFSVGDEWHVEIAFCPLYIHLGYIGYVVYSYPSKYVSTFMLVGTCLLLSFARQIPTHVVGRCLGEVCPMEKIAFRKPKPTPNPY